MNNFKLTEKVNQKKERTIIIKDRQGFTQVSNQMLSDKNISYKAKGILCHLLSHDQDKFTVTSDTLIQHGSDGFKAIKTGIQELKRNGYLKILREAGNKGKWSYIINAFGNKFTDIPKIGEWPKSDQSVLGSCYNKNTNKKNNNKNSEEEQAPQPIQETPLQSESLTHSQSFQTLGIGIQRPEQILQAIYRQLSSEGIKFDRGSDVQTYVKYRDQIEADTSLLVEKINRMRKLAWLKENYVPLKRNITNEKAVKILDGMVTLPNTFSWAFSNYSTEVEPLFELVQKIQESNRIKQEREQAKRDEEFRLQKEKEEELKNISWEEKEKSRIAREEAQKKWHGLQKSEPEKIHTPDNPVIRVRDDLLNEIRRITREASGRAFNREEEAKLQQLYKMAREAD